MTETNPRLRLGVLGVVVLSLFASLLTRLWYLQMLEAPTFEVAARVNAVRVVSEPAPRGRIIDRAGRVLVDNRSSSVVAVNRSVLPAQRRAEVIGRLSALLGLTIDDVERRLADVRYSQFRPTPIAVDVADDVVVYVREHADDFPGVVADQVAERAYPQGNLAAHLLGYVGEINDRELAERRDRGYGLGDNIGKSGVEQVYEAELRGTPGLEKLEVDSKGRVLRSLAHRAPVQGRDVQLTVDLDVQRLAEESLRLGLEAARQRHDSEDKKPFKARAGAVVVLDPRDGAIVAMASYPTYEPAAFVNGIRTDVFRRLNDPKGYFPLLSRAVQSQYAPGSTFKLFTAVAALQRGLITSRTTILDRGSHRLRRCLGTKCVFRNAGGARYGRIAVTRAITVSSDVFFYALGESFWEQRQRYGEAIQDSARAFGLGEPTGVPLPYEAKGRVPDPETRKRLHELEPEAFPEGRWFTGDNVNLAIGQGEVVTTPLQLAASYATFANGGAVWAPRVAARSLDGRGRTVEEFAPRQVRRVELPAAVRQPILAGLAGVTSAERGTARGAFLGFPLGQYPIAGKTGTAQVRGKQDTALFVGFGPVDRPEYVVTVVMEESGFGGETAAPVARRIFDGLAGQPPGPVTLGTSFD